MAPVLPMNVKMRSFSTRHLRGVMFMGAMRAKCSGEVSFWPARQAWSPAGLPRNFSMVAPYSLTMDASENRFIADDGNSRVRKVAVNGNITL